MINEAEVDHRIQEWYQTEEDYDYDSPYGEFFEKMTYGDSKVVLGGSEAKMIDNGIRLADCNYRYNFVVFTIENQTFIMESPYDSWAGTTWDDAEIYPVVQKEKTITVWERA